METLLEAVDIESFRINVFVNKTDIVIPVKMVTRLLGKV